MLAECSDSLLVIADQVGSDVAGVIGAEDRKSGNLHRNHLAVDLHLGRTAGRKNQVADLLRGMQHGAEQSWSRDSASPREPL